MNEQVPPNYRLAYSPEVIASRVQQLGRQVGNWAAEAEGRCGDQVLSVCVMRGGMFFFADLVRAAGVSMEIASCRTWGYSSSSNEKNPGAVRVSMSDIVSKDRAILIVDDICDTGATLKKLQNVFLELGACEVKTAVLIHRQVENSQFTPDWSAFEYQGTEWFAGFGLDDRNRNANLAGVYTLLR